MRSISENSMLPHAHLIIILQMLINNSSYSSCHISSSNKSCLVYNCLQPFFPIFLETGIMSAFLQSQHLIHWLLTLDIVFMNVSTNSSKVLLYYNGDNIVFNFFQPYFRISSIYLFLDIYVPVLSLIFLKPLLYIHQSYFHSVLNKNISFMFIFNCLNLIT